MPQQQLSEAEQAVLNVIAAESAAWYRRDFATYANCWAHAPYVRRMGWATMAGVHNFRGWDAVGRNIQDRMIANPTPDPKIEVLQFENVVVRISGKMAYATFDQLGPDAPSIGLGGRVLEWIDGQWRIVFLTFVTEVVEAARLAIFSVNRDASIYLMNRPAEAVIKVASPLRLVAGRLAGSETQETRQIRAAIQTAWDRDKTTPDRPQVRVPVMLHRDGDAVVSVAWVASTGLHGGGVRVTLNDLSFAQDNLAAAATVFALSPTQQRLAELIASGHDVVASASLLGITAATARTHLQRIYDKTGVRNQAALVRTLLSIERPE